MKKIYEFLCIVLCISLMGCAPTEKERKTTEHWCDSFDGTSKVWKSLMLSNKQITVRCNDGKQITGSLP